VFSFEEFKALGETILENDITAESLAAAEEGQAS